MRLARSYAILAAFCAMLEGGGMNTRKGFIRDGFGIAAILAAQSAPAILVRSMVAARNGIMVAAKGLSAKSYVQSGLIAMWDGIENAGWGVHDANATRWVNLGSLGSYYDANRSGGTFSDTGAEFLRNGTCFSLPNDIQTSRMGSEWSYEIVFTPRAGWFNNYSGLFGDHGAGLGICGGQYEGGVIYFKLYYPNVASFSILPSSIVENIPMSISSCASGTSGFIKYFRDGFFAKEFSPLSVSDVKLTDSRSHFYIGRAYPDQNRLFDGVIHCLRIYSRALIAAEVAANNAVDKARFNLP